MQLEIAPASEPEYPVVCNLARFYIYDMSEYTGWHFPPDGLFDSQERFANYWNRPGPQHSWPPEWRGFPFLIRIDSDPAGFALVKRLSEKPAVYDMGEFFIGRQHRRNGAGRRVAFELFNTFPGQWEIREMPGNVPAQAFWRRVVEDYTGGKFTENREIFPAYGGREFIVQRFQSKEGAAKAESRA